MSGTDRNQGSSSDWVFDWSCCVFAWLIAGVTLVALCQTREVLGKAKVWDVHSAWRQTQCEVLSAGVSCTGKDTKSTCAGYKVGAMPKSRPPVFLAEEIAVCPGTYWCSKERDICNCRGEVTYATELFNGEVYTVPQAERRYKVLSNGTWLCGTDQSGQGYKEDPASGRVKHCWCTPQEILDIVNRHGPLYKKRCAETANADFNSAAWRRLQFACEDASQECYSYTPWALVTVSSDQETDFAFDTSANAHGRQLRCAYEYGVPAASTALYTSEGAYGGDVWKAEAVAHKWGQQASRPCWIQTRGESREDSLQTCAVALEKPISLEGAARNQENSDYWRFFLALGFSLVCTGYVGSQCYFQRYERRREDCDSSSPEG